MSRTRTTSLGLVAKFAGMSVNGTSVSPAASTGSAHSGIPTAARPAAASPPFRIVRRLVTCPSLQGGAERTAPLLGCRLFRNDEVEQLERRGPAMRNARVLGGAQVDAVSLRHLVIFAVEGNRGLTFHQVQQLVGLCIGHGVVLFAGVQPPERAHDVPG